MKHIMSCSLSLLLLGGAGCKSVAPAAPAKKDFPQARTTNAQPEEPAQPNPQIPIGASLAKGQRQEIRMLSITESRNLSSKLWLAGKGSAILNGGGGFYFWNSSTPPQIEVELLLAGITDAAACEAIVKAGIPNGMQLAIVGNGVFHGSEIDGTTLGFFQLDSIEKFELIDK